MKKSKRKKLCVALLIPCLDHIVPQTDMCIQALIEWTRLKDIKTLYIQTPGIRLIHEARNHLIQQALSVEEVTHILFIDSDMSFMFNQLYNWLCAEKDIIGGCYVGRGIPSVPWVEHKVKPFPYAWIYDEVSDQFKTVIKKGTGIQKIAGGFGCGLVLIKREVFKKLEQPYFDFKGYPGEDMYFFRKCIEANIDVYIDWDSGLGHLGQYCYQYSDFENYVKTEEGQKYIKSLEQQGGLG